MRSRTTASAVVPLKPPSCNRRSPGPLAFVQLATQRIRAVDPTCEHVVAAPGRCGSIRAASSACPRPATGVGRHSSGLHTESVGGTEPVRTVRRRKKYPALVGAKAAVTGTCLRLREAGRPKHAALSRHTGVSETVAPAQPLLRRWLGRRMAARQLSGVFAVRPSNTGHRALCITYLFARGRSVHVR